MTAEAPTHRGTTNRNDRGSSYARRARRRWLIENYAADQAGFCRCYRCGTLLYNPDALPPTAVLGTDGSSGGGELAVALAPSDQFPYASLGLARPVTVDRIIPGRDGGTYRRNNIRPACGPCNSETGGGLARRGKK